MKKLLFSLLLSASLLGCKVERSPKFATLDSLKKAYAGKEIKISLSNTQSGSTRLTTQYAYTDDLKKDLAFELNSWNKFKISDEEAYEFIPTTEKLNDDENEMVLIETINEPYKKGYVHYSYISEFYIMNAYNNR